MGNPIKLYKDAVSAKWAMEYSQIWIDDALKAIN